MDVVCPQVIQSITELKSTMGLGSTSLDTKEILCALASSSVLDRNARKCLDALNKLKGCEMHTTHLTNEGDEKILNQIGLILTTDAKLPFPDY